MEIGRRAFTSTLAAAALAACGRPRRFSRPPDIDTKLLDRQFPDLADRARPGEFNAGLMSLDTGQLWFWNADRRFPLQDAFKAPLAAAALAEVDAGRARLDEAVRVTALDLSPGHGLINPGWPTPPDDAAKDFRLRDLLSLSVVESDNTAADVLMKRIGGPGAVTAWLRNKAIFEMRIDRYERELQQEMAGMAPFRPAWKDEAVWVAARVTIPPAARQGAMDAYLSDPRDTTTAPDALNFLSKLADEQLLSKASTALLLKLMTGAKGGEARLKGGLPKGARIAHMPGSSGTDLGFTPATSDIGVVTLGDGRRYAIAAFLSGSTATEAQRDRVFADTARLMIKAAK
jgi:beta-lactamase class A